MDELITALADPARWTLVELLAERPRPVGVLAQLAGARQPQTTKHLQTLERAGAVTSERSGQRRIYTLTATPLRELAAELVRLADAAERPGGPGDTFEEHGRRVAAERRAADRTGWADDRSFGFVRTLRATREQVWQHLTDPTLLAAWWAPDDLRVSELVFEPRPGGQVVLEYRDADDADGSDAVVGRAEGAVDEVTPAEHLAYHSSPLLADGSAAFTSHVDLRLRSAADGTDLSVTWRISGSKAGGVDFVAGIEVGLGQSLDKLAAILAALPDSKTTSPRKATGRNSK